MIVLFIVLLVIFFIIGIVAYYLYNRWFRKDNLQQEISRNIPEKFSPWGWITFNNIPADSCKFYADEAVCFFGTDNASLKLDSPEKSNIITSVTKNGENLSRTEMAKYSFANYGNIQPCEYKFIPQYDNTTLGIRRLDYTSSTLGYTPKCLAQNVISSRESVRTCLGTILFGGNYDAIQQCLSSTGKHVDYDSFYTERFFETCGVDVCQNSVFLARLKVGTLILSNSLSFVGSLPLTNSLGEPLSFFEFTAYDDNLKENLSGRNYSIKEQKSNKFLSIDENTTLTLKNIGNVITWKYIFLSHEDTENIKVGNDTWTSAIIYTKAKEFNDNIKILINNVIDNPEDYWPYPYPPPYDFTDNFYSAYDDISRLESLLNNRLKTGDILQDYGLIFNAESIYEIMSYFGDTYIKVNNKIKDFAGSILPNINFPVVNDMSDVQFCTRLQTYFNNCYNIFNTVGELHNISHIFGILRNISTTNKSREEYIKECLRLSLVISPLIISDSYHDNWEILKKLLVRLRNYKNINEYSSVAGPYEHETLLLIKDIQLYYDLSYNVDGGLIYCEKPESIPIIPSQFVKWYQDNHNTYPIYSVYNTSNNGTVSIQKSQLEIYTYFRDDYLTTSYFFLNHQKIEALNMIN